MTDSRGNSSVEGGAEPAQAPADVESERDRTGEGANSVEAVNERADAIDGTTAGDGVQLFEGDLGLDNDIERSG